MRGHRGGVHSVRVLSDSPGTCGQIHIIDRGRVEQSAFECYAGAKAEYERIFCG
jgi:hypothetical protein